MPVNVPAVSFATSESTSGAETGTHNITVNLVPAPQSGIALNYELSGTATMGSDYRITGVTDRSAVIEVPAGTNSVDVPISILDDSAVEDDETILLRLTEGAGYTVGSPAAHAMTITDNDELPTTLTLRVEPEPMEGVGLVTVTAFLNGPAPPGGTTVTLSLSGTAAGTGDGADYTLSSTKINMAEGETAGTATLMIVDDAVADHGETIVIDAASTNPGLSAETHTSTITDNDQQGVVLSPDALSVIHGQGGTYSVHLASRPEADATVVVTPRSDNPHIRFNPVSITFDAETWNTPQQVSFMVADDFREGSLTIKHEVSGYGDGTTSATLTVDVVPETASDELSYKLCPRDHRDLDGDKVHVEVNQERVFEDHVLTNRMDDCRTIQLKRNPQRNSIVVVAIDEGSVGSNTAELRIVHAVTEVELATDNWSLKEGDQQGWEVYAQSEDEVTLRPIGGGAEEILVKDAVQAVAAAAVANVSANIGTRFSGSPGGPPALTLAGVPVGGTADWWAMHGARRRQPSVLDRWESEVTWREARSLSVEELLGRSAFQVALSAAEGGTGTNASAGWTMWGRGDLLRLESDAGKEGSFDGNILAGYLGLDKQVTDQWTLGLAGSRIGVSADYALDGGDGELDLTLTGVHPYARFASAQGTEFSLILGWGAGKIENAREGTTGRETTDAKLLMAGIGGRRRVASAGVFPGMDVTLLGDLGYGKMTGDSDEDLEILSDLAVDTLRVRGGVEGSYTTQLVTGATLTPFAEVAARYDGGSGDDSTGLEVAGGVTYAMPAQGLGLQARVNALALSSKKDYREYGASATLSLTPRTPGRGLSVAVTPRYGRPSGRADALWGRDSFALGEGSRDTEFAFDARVEYGLPVLPFAGTAAPFAELQWLGHEDRRVRGGLRIGIQTPAGSGPSMRRANIELHGERITRAYADAEQRVNLQASWRF